MRNKIASVLLITATLGLGTAAMAQNVVPTMGPQESTGIITKVDEIDKTVTLADGHTYYFSSGYNVYALQSGQRVAVSWEDVAGRRTVDSLHFQG